MVVVVVVVVAGWIWSGCIVNYKRWNQEEEEEEEEEEEGVQNRV